MIAFNPEITVVVGSTVSIFCSFLCLIGFYLVHRQSKNRSAEMITKIEKLSKAFTSLTNVLMGETDNETKNDVPSDDSASSSTDPDFYGLRNPRIPDPVPDDSEGKDSRKGSMHKVLTNPHPSAGTITNPSEGTLT